MTKDVKKFIKNELKRVVLIFKYFLKKKNNRFKYKTYKETLTKMSTYRIFSNLVRPLISADGHFFKI